MKNEIKRQIINDPEKIKCVIEMTADEDVIDISFRGLFREKGIMDEIPLIMELGGEYIDIAFNSVSKETDYILAKAGMDKVTENFERGINECREVGTREWMSSQGVEEEDIVALENGRSDELSDLLLAELKSIDASKIKVVYKRNNKSKKN